jgi:hypothetical protein
VENGLKETKVLHDLLELLARSIQEKTADIVSSQEVALQASAKQLSNEADILMAVLSAAVSSSVSLQNQVVSLPTNHWEVNVNQSRK